MGEGFLSRFLATHGEGPHHLTFTVPDLADAVCALGLTVTGENYDPHEGPPEDILIGGAALAAMIAKGEP